MQNKIYWNGFKRQLIKLYYLLLWEKYISCELDDFMSHFTGKKFRVELKYNGKLEWNCDAGLLAHLVKHLTSKRFLDAKFTADHKNILSTHFNGITAEDIDLDTENITNAANDFQQKLDLLFPENSGYRCKERLFYKQRNLQRLTAVLKSCSIN